MKHCSQIRAAAWPWRCWGARAGPAHWQVPGPCHPAGRRSRRQAMAGPGGAAGAAAAGLGWWQCCLHELGHALMGRRKGFRFHWLAVGPFMWKMREGRLRFEWNKNLNTAGGMVLSTPTGDHDLRRRFMAFAIGGPLWPAWCGPGWRWEPTPCCPRRPRRWAGCYGWAWGPVAAFLVCWRWSPLIPMHTGGFYSDGARVLNLWRDGAAGQLEMAVVSALARSVAGVRPRELPRSTARSRRRAPRRAALQALRALLPLPGRPRRRPAGASCAPPGRIPPAPGR